VSVLAGQEVGQEIGLEIVGQYVAGLCLTYREIGFKNLNSYRIIFFCTHYIIQNIYLLMHRRRRALNRLSSKFP